MADEVILRHAEKDFAVRGSVLRCHSSVFDGILADGAPTEEGMVLTIDGVSKEAVGTFVDLLSYLSHDDCIHELGCELDDDDIVDHAEVIMPMVHKYDAKGLLRIIHSAVNAKPKEAVILAILKHDDSVDWMTVATKQFLVKKIFEDTRDSTYEPTTTPAYQKLDALPRSALQALLWHVMVDAQLNGARRQLDGSPPLRSRSGAPTGTVIVMPDVPPPGSLSGLPTKWLK